jgi:hypothetical protein
VSDRERVRIPKGRFDLVVELDDGTVVVLEGARIGTIDARPGGDVRIAGEWDRSREKARQERAEQSRRDRDVFDFRVDWSNVASAAFNTAQAMRDLEEVMRAARAAARPPPPPPTVHGTWRVVLGFREHERPSIADVKRKHRQLMAKAHPDAGGSHERAVALNGAMDEAKAELRQTRTRVHFG